MGWRSGDCIDVAQDGEMKRAVVYAVMKLQALYNAVNFLKINELWSMGILT